MKTDLPQLQISPIPKSSAEIMDEIKILELKVRQLEEYLLSLYRKAFDNRVISSSSKTMVDNVRDCLEISRDHAKNVVHPREDIQVILDSSIHRSLSSLSHHSSRSIQSPHFTKVSEAIYSYHSVPLALLENGCGEASNSVISLVDHVSVNDSGQIRETANWVSEEMVRSISAIYCQLSGITHDFFSPVLSFESLEGGFSPLGESNLCTPSHRANASFYLLSDGPIHAVGDEEFRGPCSSQTVDILEICRDSEKLREIEPMLQKFRSLVNKLEGLKPEKLRHEEKLAFWINVHNALVMHAFLVHGVPPIKIKRISLLLKVAYDIGDHTINVDMIQNYILGCRLPHPGQWFHKFLNPMKKFKTGVERKSFSLERPEPLSYFALSCGSHSDPPVRAYTPKTVFQDLIAARGEYILSNYKILKGQNKIMLPKMMDVYAKDSGLHPDDFVGIIDHILPEDYHINRNRKGWKKNKKANNIGWIPHDFSFHYQLSKDLFFQP